MSKGTTDKKIPDSTPKEVTEKKAEKVEKVEGTPKESKKSSGGSSSHASTSQAHSQIAGVCFSWGCKKNSDRFNFCEEHYEHFKFGLIKKTGEPVSDYEKKFEHYKSFQMKRSAQKVA